MERKCWAPEIKWGDSRVISSNVWCVLPRHCCWYAKLLFICLPLFNIRHPLPSPLPTSTAFPPHMPFLKLQFTTRKIDALLREIVLSTKCLPCKHEALSSDHQHPCDVLGVVAHACNPSVGESEMAVFWIFLTSQFIQWTSFRLSKRPFLKTYGGN